MEFDQTVTGDYLGTSGLSGMMDSNRVLHLAYWSAGQHITHRAYTYDPAAHTFNLVAGPTRLDQTGPSNHPSLAVSPKDNSVTVAWISEEGTPKVLARSLPAGGSWGSIETVGVGRPWTSTNFGINIDQGPSILIDPAGTKHLVYIEHFDGTGSYGRVRYTANTGTGWLETTLPTYSHAPALALNQAGDLYIIGHGHPNNQTCRSMDDMCVIKRAVEARGCPCCLPLRLPVQASMPALRSNGRW